MEDAQEKNIRVYREYYSAFARDYEERTKEGAKKIAETMMNWINLTGFQVLDMGVGTGSVWEELHKKGINNVHVVGSDIAPGALKIAKEKHIPWLEVLEKKAEDIDYVNYFDLVCAHGLLKHCASPEPIVRRGYAALKKEGLFSYEDLAYEDQVLKVGRQFVAEAKKYLKPAGRKTSFNRLDSEMLGIIEDDGFSLQRYETFTYKTRFGSMEQIKRFFLEKTLLGIYTFRTIPAKYKKKCEKIFAKTIQNELKEPALSHARLICLFKKV